MGEVGQGGGKRSSLRSENPEEKPGKAVCFKKGGENKEKRALRVKFGRLEAQPQGNQHRC